MTEEIASHFPTRFRRNVLSSYASTAFVALVGLITTPLLARGLGPERYGIWALIGSMIVYVDLLQFGFVGAAARDVAAAEARGDREHLVRTVATSLYVMLIPALVSLGLTAAFAAFAPELFNIRAAYVHDARVLTVLIGAGIAVALPGQSVTSVLTGLQRYDLLYGSEIAYWTLLGAAWASIVLTGGGLIQLGVAGLAMGLALLFVRLAIALRLVPELSLAPRYFDKALVGALSRLSGWLAIAEAATIVLYRIDTFVVGAVAGVPAAGIYAVGQKLASTADKAIRPMVTGLFPFAAELAGRNDTRRLRNAVLAGTRLSLAVAVPISVTLVVLAHPLLNIWVGKSFAGARDVVVYLGLTTIVIALSRPGTLTLQGAGKARVPALLAIAEGGLNLGLSIGFGIWIGLTGVALGTLVASATFRLAVFIPYMCRQFQIPISAFVAATLRAHLAPTVASLLAAWLLLQLSLSDLPTIALVSVFMIATYTVVFARTGLQPEQRQQLLAQVRTWRRGAVATPP